MKFNKISRKKFGFSLLQTMIVIAILGLLAVITMQKAQAQPYFTNTGTIYGAQSYNSSLGTPIKPSAILAAQYAAGEIAGSIAPATIPNAGFYTNTFTTNIFSAPPFVVANSSITNNSPAIVSTSPTNFVISVLNTNCTIYWQATGH